MQSTRHRRLGPPHRPGQLPGHAEHYKAGLEESVYHPQRDGLGHPPSQIPPRASSSPGASPTMRPRGLPLPGKVSSPSDLPFNRQSLPVTDPAGSRHSHSEALDEGTPLPRPLQRTLWPRLAPLGDGGLVTSQGGPRCHRLSFPLSFLPQSPPSPLPPGPPAPLPPSSPLKSGDTRGRVGPGERRGLLAGRGNSPRGPTARGISRLRGGEWGQEAAPF